MGSATAAGSCETYVIKVKGRLDESWPDWFGRLAITTEGSKEGVRVTTLSGVVVDQTELRGILDSLWNLNLELLSAVRVQSRDRTDHRANR